MTRRCAWMRPAPSLDRLRYSCSAVAILLWSAPVSAALPAITVPGSADSGRVATPPPSQPAPPLERAPSSGERFVYPGGKPPKNARGLTLELKDLKIEGADGIDQEQIDAISKPFVGHVVTLDTVWVIANQITEKYREKGFFLSHAYVPAQTIENGVVKIKVAEGYLDEIHPTGEGADEKLVYAWNAKLRHKRPLKTDDLEQAMLEINQLPDANYRSVLKPINRKHAPNGAVAMDVIGEKKPARAFAQVDNYGSRYLGPYQATLQYQPKIIPGQATTVTAMVASQWSELKNFAVNHVVPYAPGWVVDGTVNYTTAQPGYLLKVHEIDSKTYGFDTGITHHWIWHRSEQLASRFGFEWRDSSSDILNTPLARDKLRMAKLGATYALADRFGGSDNLEATITQGLNLLGASQAGGRYLSRSDARPDFTKLELSAARLQAVREAVDLLISAKGQVSSAPLYSSEEFGYGGQNYGRAYDNSEITGDHGVSLAAELRYTGLQKIRGATPTPYLFYDIGRVWNESRAQVAMADASSAGAGMRIESDEGVRADLGVAVPLSREASDPIYSHNGSAPRLRASLSYTF